MSHHDPAAEYTGPATLRVGEVELGVQVRLRGGFQPIDGRFHWYGRVDRDDAVEALGSGTEVVLEVGAARASGRLSDVDPWGRFRVSGTGRPPF